MLVGDDFIRLLDPYMKKALRKGIPPLFVDLRPLYADPDKVKATEELCLKYLTNLKTHTRFDDGGSEGGKEPITALLWLYYYLGQHYDYKKEYDEALKFVNEAIEHTPTLIELYLLKGKIYKVGSCFILIHQADQSPWW